MAKLGAVSISGQPEDQLRGPFEQLLTDLCLLSGRDPRLLNLIGETSLADLSVRPDYAVEYDGALLGFLEIKAPGKGADPRLFRDPHDKEQWKKLQALPNLIYFDGQEMSLWQNGDLQGPIVRFTGDLVSAGAALSAPDSLMRLLETFYSWTPIAPRSPQALAQMSARLCRLLRDEASEQLALNNRELRALMNDWKSLLFPEATEAQFADWYAQSVTFGLLLARARGIDLNNGVAVAARELSVNTKSLIGSALRALVDTAVAKDALQTSVATMGRVLAVVDWDKISKNDSEAWLYFYEGFLQTYDTALRKKTGSYYTPVEVVRAMTGLVDEALVNQLHLPSGLADNAVTIVDPAMGTGTFLLEIVRKIAEHTAADLGPGAVGPAMEDVLKRIIGFELQLGPYAVAQLRLLAELTEFGGTSTDPNQLRTYVTNTLDDPFIEETSLGSWYQPITDARRAANKAKAEEEVLVVIGNPPYKDKSKGKGGWIEHGSEAVKVPPLEVFFPDKEWGVGSHTKHLYNMYVYFWRWATWKVFDNHQPNDKGVICFITVAGFVNGLGFQGMRKHLRESADEIWVIGCSPEGFTPPVNTRVFEAMKHEVCIVLAVKNGTTTSTEPAKIRYRELASGHRTEKFVELEKIRLSDSSWEACPTDWRAPFLPSSKESWLSYPRLGDLFRYDGSGTMPGRTWVIDPDTETLYQRWDTLISARDVSTQKTLMQEHKTDRRIDTLLSDNLPGFRTRHRTIANEKERCDEPVQIAFRSFDRQRLIPDKRVINRPNPTLWSARSDQQMWLTAPASESPKNGPALTSTALMPDLHHYGGRGGRAYPLWLDAEATVSNIVPGVSAYLAETMDIQVEDQDLFAYVVSVASHGGYTEAFTDDLEVPGLRIPITNSPELFSEAVAVGREVLWLQSYGTRFVEVSEGRPAQAPRLTSDEQPRIPLDGSISTRPEDMPEDMVYDADNQELYIGTGRISNVTLAMWEYEVSGMNVLKQWFSSRQKNRERPVIGERAVSPLLKIQSDRWLPEYTSHLIDLLNLLGLLSKMEVTQRILLEKISAMPQFTLHDLERAGIMPLAKEFRDPKKVIAEAQMKAGTLFD